MSVRLTFVALLVTVPLLGCGTKAGPDITFSMPTAATAFADANVTDFYFELTNTSSADLYYFPDNCRVTSLQANCGYTSAQRGTTVTLGALPLNATYQVVVRFRDATGKILYGGTSAFVNDGHSQSLSISVAGVTP
ncbi:MAG: hypothetical protein V1495_08100 [Pseudomonadota bacterium]